ncbi:hypothetical protein GCM10023340_14060 [Nocardioides marinquilinus]|uniref:Bifunctional diguanylate cyclase/phosphodiesterase n=1 Tax=Nocardioides marinquilinus TaxID=1210400 RepID=A0ABP9PHF9_9ACTN
MTPDERTVVDVLAEAAIEMPWPEAEIEPWLLSFARRVMACEVRIGSAPAPPPDVSLLFADQRFLVATRPDGGPPFDEADTRLLAALTAMATASRHAARRDERLRRQAVTDDLTGLWHHNYFRELLEATVEGRVGETIGVLFLDVDGMKRLNEHLGHLDADEVLRVLGSRLRSDVLPEGSFAARMGGDEFAVVLRHLDGDDGAAHLERIVADLHAALGAGVAVGDTLVTVDVSIGAALSTAGDDDPDLLLREAERQMRERKRSRRPDALPPRWYDDRTVLRDMLDQGRVEVAYQPIVELASGRVDGWEALVRGRHLDFGPVSPMMLVGAASKLRMLDELTEAVLDQSLEAMRTVTARLGRPAALSVNIEFEQLRLDSRLLRSLPERIAGTDVRLVLEISERHVSRWSPAQRMVAGELAEAGIGLAVDDFGTGYSALSLLTSWEWHWIKIDRALVADLGTRQGRTVLGHVARMLADLGHTAVAEGVETESELTALRDLGLALGQGTHFAAPTSADAVLASLEPDAP